MNIGIDMLSWISNVNFSHFYRKKSVQFKRPLCNPINVCWWNSDESTNSSIATELMKLFCDYSIIFRSQARQLADESIVNVIWVCFFFLYLEKSFSLLNFQLIVGFERSQSMNAWTLTKQQSHNNKNSSIIVIRSIIIHHWKWVSRTRAHSMHDDSP